MVQKFNKRFTPERFQSGEFVTLKIPREDRASTDNFRIYCKVIEEPHPNQYQLQCKHGILTTQYPIKDLLRIPANAFDAAEAQLLNAPNKKVRVHGLQPTINLNNTNCTLADYTTCSSRS
jgi:hypothetical protein